MSPRGRTWQIRSVDRSEATLFARLEAASFPDPWSADDLALYLDSGAVVAYVAGAAGPAADAVAHALFQLLPGEAELLRIGVDPGHRRQGAARALLAGSLERLAAAGRPVCHLEVRTGNRAARALYEALGFRVVGLRRAYYADREDAVRYRRGDDSDAL